MSKHVPQEVGGIRDREMSKWVSDKTESLATIKGTLSEKRAYIASILREALYLGMCGCHCGSFNPGNPCNGVSCNDE